jgi:hypothetical protein
MRATRVSASRSLGFVGVLRLLSKRVRPPSATPPHAASYRANGVIVWMISPRTWRYFSAFGSPLQ